MEPSGANWFAMLALLAWPIFAVALYQARPLAAATIWTVLGAFLLLPVGAAIKLAPGIPQLDKFSVSNLAALVGYMWAGRSIRFCTRLGVAEILIVMIIIGPFITSELNGDAIRIGATFLPSVGHYEALSAAVSQFISLIPFFVARQVLRTASSTTQILRALVGACLIYSVLMLFEIRMSPQLHAWVYGYTPSENFIQEMRDGGFRPAVFTGHGLLAALFTMTATVAAAALWRTKARVWQLPIGGVTAYLAAILLLCKSMGALLYGLALVPLVRFFRPQLQLRIAIVLAAFALSYPLLRTLDLVPIEAMVNIARSVNPERADSLGFRFNQETPLLERAAQRMLFGWGRFGRSRIYSDTGKDISITDGRWIITLGQFGLFGFIAEFGLLVLPVFQAGAAIRNTRDAHDKVHLAALSLILAINAIDLLPNATLIPWTWILAGALLGRVEALQASARPTVRIRTPSPPDNRAFAGDQSMLKAQLYHNEDNA
jgi:hypothetical protein